jgi:alpha-tubulin suppressor-like RCC1 family protein
LAVTATLLAAGLLWSGIGTDPASAAPAARVSAGRSHTCAVTAGGLVRCWGGNEWAQVGDGTNATRLTLVKVQGLGQRVAEVSAGSDHTCALTTGGAVKCWGGNAFGQIGDGSTDATFTPVTVSGLGSGVAAIASGTFHTCALTTGGGVKCWGYGRFGQLGDGTEASSTTPVAVEGLGSGVTAIAAGQYHTCALTSSGGATCWGSNEFGQLGDGTTTDRPAPVEVSGLDTGVTAISAGIAHTCAVAAGGAATCWGGNLGALGDGTETDRLTPVVALGLDSGVASISAGGFHTCALTDDGGAACWGYNDSGQLGDGTTSDRLSPVDVSGLDSGVTAISAGRKHTCALVGTVAKCWGQNVRGKLGDGTKHRRTTPVDVIGLGGEPAATTLSIHAPGQAKPGTSFRVSGTLGSELESCRRFQTVVLSRDGKGAGATTTKASGSYAFTLKVKKNGGAKKMTVRVSFGKRLACRASASPTLTIELA